MVLSGVMYYWLSRQPLIDEKTVAQADFPVYVPRHEPWGYELQASQTRITKDMLVYVLEGKAAGKNITVSVQPRPAGFNMTQLSEGGSISSAVIQNGTLYNLSTGESSKYLLDSGDALIFMTSPASIDTATVNALAISFSRLN